MFLQLALLFFYLHVLFMLSISKSTNQACKFHAGKVYFHIQIAIAFFSNLYVLLIGLTILFVCHVQILRTTQKLRTAVQTKVETARKHLVNVVLKHKMTIHLQRYFFPKNGLIIISWVGKWGYSEFINGKSYCKVVLLNTNLGCHVI